MVWTRGGGLPALYQTASQPTGPLLPFLCQGFQWAGAQALHLSCPAWHHNQSGANQSTPTGPQALCMAVPITLTTPLCPHVQVTRVGGALSAGLPSPDTPSVTAWPSFPCSTHLHGDLPTFLLSLVTESRGPCPMSC